jgi:hypothetical protein
MQSLDLAAELLFPDLFLDGVDPSDAREPLARSLGIRGFGLEWLQHCAWMSLTCLA